MLILRTSMSTIFFWENLTYQWFGFVCSTSLLVLGRQYCTETHESVSNSKKKIPDENSKKGKKKKKLNVKKEKKLQITSGLLSKRKLIHSWRRD